MNKEVNIKFWLPFLGIAYSLLVFIAAALSTSSALSFAIAIPAAVIMFVSIIGLFTYFDSIY